MPGNVSARAKAVLKLPAELNIEHKGAPWVMPAAHPYVGAVDSETEGEGLG